MGAVYRLLTGNYSDLSLHVSNPIPAGCFSLKAVALACVDYFIGYLVDNDISTVVSYGSPVFSVLLHIYDFEYVLSKALMTLPVPFIVASIYGSIALRSLCDVINRIKSVDTPSLIALTINVLRAVCVDKLHFGVRTSIFCVRRYS